ncbi:transcription termination/antitermination protein NusG [Paludisphaera soli]|uniref:transcription termination/antitermination protein NusG n=1 Tax=Paludisphaera soli TaxID=2712865 RepID=UPI0013EE0310|nr:transcription termination/antitermination NusG family protein [Paludisphaera soli]
MTILAAEADFHPETLWDESPPASPDSPEVRWCCLHTKPRQEKAVARELRQAGLSFYLPQILHESHTPQGRAIRSLIPLFPGYVFLKGDQNDRVTANRRNRLVGVLEVFDQEALRQDLQRIHAMLRSGLPLAAEPHVQPGMCVRIKSGPLAGIEGLVVRRGGGDHFVAIVRFLSRGTSVQLQDWQVEPISQRGTSREAFTC